MDDRQAYLEELISLGRLQERELAGLRDRAARRRFAMPGRLLLSVGVIVLLATIGGVTYASVPSTSDGLIHGCDAKTGGKLVIIDTQKSPPQTCGATQNAITWSPNGSPSHRQEITNAASPTQITVPANVTSISLELWGAGGGGGADITCQTSQGSVTKFGGPGGSGAYIRTIVPVAPGGVVTITIGAGGTGSVGNGGDGGATLVATGATTVASAGGGKGGEQAGGTQGCGSSGGYYGRAGAGGAVVTAPAGNTISLGGNTQQSFIFQRVAPVQGSVQLPANWAYGGDGVHASGNSGGDGFAIVSW